MSSTRGPQIDSWKLSANLVLTGMQGHIDAPICAHQLSPFIALLEAMPSPCWIIDTLQISGFDPGAVSWGGRWFHAFKARGGERVAFVSSYGPARMAARALSFSAGLKVMSFEKLEDARARIETLRNFTDDSTRRSRAP